MSLGIDATLKLIEDVKSAVVDSIALVKGGPFSIFKLGAVIKLVGDVQGLIMDGQAALPELKDVDADEAGKLAAASYSAVKDIVLAIGQK